jgi:hypothetical protein
MTRKRFRVTVALFEKWIAEVTVRATTAAEARERVEGLDPRSLRYTLLDECAEVDSIEVLGSGETGLSNKAEARTPPGEENHGSEKD